MRRPASVNDLVARGMAEAVEVGECLEWQGKMGNTGGQIPVVKSREGRAYSYEYSVPRVLWENNKGRKVPRGHVCYRTCCNNKCVNIKHLAVGTRAEWLAHIKEAGQLKRSADQIVTATKAARKRQTTVNSIEKAREVRTLLGDHTYKEVAEITGVSYAMVADIARGRAWRDQANPFAALFG